MRSASFRSFLATALSVLAAVVAPPATAQDEAATLLTVVTPQAEYALSRADLDAIGCTHVTTRTIWTEGEQDFAGVPLVDLVRAFGAEAGGGAVSLRAQAINDYTVIIPVTDAVEGGPIIAHTRNGASMTIRDNGPLWLIYPYDSNPDYRTEVIYARSIWQLERIELVAAP